MIERFTRSPLLLAAAFVLSAALGAAIYSAIPGGGERAQMEAVVRDYVLAHPEIIPEAMERLHARETGKVVAANRAAIVEPFGSAWEGAKDGDVTLVAFMDYACGYCRASLPILDQVLASDPKLKVVYRELPILSEASRRAAQYSLAAAEQGKFQAYHDALYAAGPLSDETIDAAITRAGLDRARADRVANSEAVAREIEKNLRLAGQLGMTGTPAWVIGDQVLSGALPIETMREAVEKARKD